MKAVIHQPYFLPWLGYFAKLVYCDKFIVSDNDEFSKRKFIERTEIINSSGDKHWITLPIGERYKEKINTIHFDNLKFTERIFQNFHSAYSKARFFKETINPIQEIIYNSFRLNLKLVDINISIVGQVLELLELKKPEIIYSSNFNYIKDDTLRIINLIKQNNCSSLITGNGGSIELLDIEKINNSNINIYLQDYYKFHPEYYQTRRTKISFAKGLSIVDCIFNEGFQKTKDLLIDKNCEPKLYKKLNN